MTKYINIFAFGLYLFGLSVAPVYQDNLHNDILPAVKDTVASVTICITGDLMCHSPQFNYAEIKKDSFDFKPVFSYVKNYLSSADLTIGNFETVLAGAKKGYSGYPLFNSPDAFLDAIKDAGFDILTTSNNHALDKGKKGVLRTIEKIDSSGIIRIGTYKSKKDRDSIRIVDIHGIKIAFLSYSFSTNGIPIPGDSPYLINLIDTTLIKKDISKAKKNKPDFVIVYFHFGDEYSRAPSGYQKNIVAKTIKYGADIILAGHPHVIQPLKYFKTNNSKIDSGFVAYSLGNFISNQRWRYSDAGVILNFTLNKNLTKDSLFISNTNYIPTWVFKGKINDENKFVILPSACVYENNIPPFITKNDSTLMKESFIDTEEILSKYTNKFKSIKTSCKSALDSIIN